MKHKRKTAIALNYDLKQGAPTVKASGKGLVAENIIHQAEEHQVPVKEDVSLANLLSELNVNETIPEQLYEAVAEVFAFIYQADEQAKKM